MSAKRVDPSNLEAEEALLARFWAKVDQRGTEDCWPWTGSCDAKGYGSFWNRGGTTRAHRLCWDITNGPAGSRHVLHRCDNPRCCNPRHLWLGSNQDNVDDKMSKGRHGWRLDSRPILRGEANPRAKLTRAAVAQIREMYELGGPSQRALARRFGVSQRCILFVLRGETWK